MSASSLRARLALPGVAGIGLLATILGPALATGCNHAPAQAPAKAVEVIVTQPITDEVTDYQDFTGRLSAVYAVDIRARVTGYLLNANFKEGAQVKKGDVLFEIDPSTFAAQVAQAEGNIAMYEARIRRLETDLRRFKSTLAKGASTQQEVDQATGDLGEAQASLKAAVAARDLAKVNLGYCKVYCPISGRISRRYVDPGNLINENNTLLTSVMSETPMYAYFDVDERTYLDLLPTSDQKANTWVKDLQFPVLMRLANEDQFARAGTVNFVDNQIIPNTGTIRMRGVFENPHGTLKPGLFVRIRLPIGQPYKALLISDEALLSDQGRKYLYVIGSNNEVIYRPVELGQEIQGLRVIKKGLAEGDRVIVSGMQRVRAGAQVQVKTQNPPKKPDSPLGRLITLNQLFPDREANSRTAQATTKSSVGEAAQSGR